MISTSNLDQAKKQIKNEKSPIIVKAQSAEFNRKILEHGNFNILLTPEQLNHVQAKIATKNKIVIGFDLKALSYLEKKQKALALSRIIKIIKICRKAKTKISLLNAKDKKDAFSLLVSLGSSTSQAKESITF